MRVCESSDETYPSGMLRQRLHAFPRRSDVSTHGAPRSRTCICSGVEQHSVITNVQLLLTIVYQVVAVGDNAYIKKMLRRLDMTSKLCSEYGQVVIRV